MSVLLLLIICVSASSRAFPTATDQDAEARINSWVINPVRRPGMSIGGLRPGGMLLMVMEPNATMEPETSIPPEEVTIPQVGVAGPTPSTTGATDVGSEHAATPVPAVNNEEGSTDTPVVPQHTTVSPAAENTDTYQVPTSSNDTIVPATYGTTVIPPEEGVSEASIDTSVVPQQATQPTATVGNEVADPDQASTEKEPVGDFNDSATSEPDVDTQGQSTDDTSEDTSTALDPSPQATTQDPSGLDAPEDAGNTEGQQGSEISPDEDDTTQDPSGSDTTNANNSQSAEVADSSDDQQEGQVNPTEDETTEDPAGSDTTEVIEEDPRPPEVTGSNTAQEGSEIDPSGDNPAQDPAGSTSDLGDSPEHSTEIVDLASSDPTEDFTELIPDAADNQDQPGSDQDDPITEPTTEVEQDTESILAEDQETAEQSTEAFQDPGQQETSQTILDDSDNLNEQGSTGSGNIPEDPENNKDPEPQQTTETEPPATLDDPDTPQGTETIPQEETPNQDLLEVNLAEIHDPEQSTELSLATDDPNPSILNEDDASEPEQSTEETNLPGNNQQDHSDSTTAEDQTNDPTQNAGPSQLADDPIHSVLSEDEHDEPENPEPNPDELTTSQDHLQDQTDETTEHEHTAGIVETDLEVSQPQEIQTDPDQDQATEAILHSDSISADPEDEQTTSFSDYLAVDPTFDPLQPHLYEDQTHPSPVETSTDPSSENADSKPSIFSGPALDDFQPNHEDVTLQVFTVPTTESDPGTEEPTAQTADSRPILSEEVIQEETLQKRKRSLNIKDESPSRQFGHRPYPIPSKLVRQIPQDPSGYGTASTVRRVYDYCYGLLCELKRNLVHFRLF